MGSVFSFSFHFPFLHCEIFSTVRLTEQSKVLIHHFHLHLLHLLHLHYHDHLIRSTLTKQANKGISGEHINTFVSMNQRKTDDPRLITQPHEPSGHQDRLEPLCWRPNRLCVPPSSSFCYESHLQSIPESITVITVILVRRVQATLFPLERCKYFCQRNKAARYLFAEMRR